MPALQASISIDLIYGAQLPEHDLMGLVDHLSAEIANASDDAHKHSETMLVAQAHTLDAIFHATLRRAQLNMGRSPEVVERYMKLALKAQNQCRCTWQAISAIRHPPVAGYIGQANIAHGPQQVNNSAAPSRSPSRENELFPDRS